jgi:uncharacterized protein (DUF302 family)
MSYYFVATRHVSTLDLPSDKEASVPAAPEAVLENGIVRIPSHHSVDETVKKLETILQAKNVKLFALVDHSGEAESVGLRMPNTKLLIFGNPKAGTPLMLASPSVALDLPLKILVAEDSTGRVWVSYNASDYLQKRHNLPTNLVPNIAVIELLAANAAQ